MSDPSSPGSKSPASAELDPWDVAPKYLSHLGSISQMVAGCARALLHDERAKLPGPTVVLSTSEFAVDRLFHSPSMLSHFYYALATYHPAKLAQRPPLAPKELPTLVEPHESAMLILITYFYRRILSRIDAAEAPAFSRQMQHSIDLAHLLGKSVPGIGLQVALMVAAGRHLGWGTFLARDAKLFKKYRVGIKIKKVPFDLKTETETWSTTHVHIACSMFQAFGFGVDTIEGYANGVMAEDPSKLGPIARKFAAAQIWLDSLWATGKAPTAGVSQDLSPLASGLAELQGLVQSQKEDPESVGGWLFSRRTDLSPERTPALIYDYGKIEPSKHSVAASEGSAEEGEF